MIKASARGRHLGPDDRLERRLAAIPAGRATVVAAALLVGAALPAGATDGESVASLQQRASSAQRDADRPGACERLVADALDEVAVT